MSNEFHRTPPITSKSAFTLVEILVAVAVLALLVVMMGQMVLLTSQAIIVNSKKLDAAAQARIVFDRIGMDWSARPTRADLGGMQVISGTGNDSFQFYSEVPGYNASNPQRQMSLVSYQVTNPPAATGQPSGSGSLCLVRGADGAVWSPTSLVFVPPTAFTQPTEPAPNPHNYDVLAGGVFRLGVCFLLQNSPNPPTYLSIYRNGVSNTGDYSNVAALVVAVAVLDSRSSSLLTPAQIMTLSSALNDCPNGNDPISVWNGQLPSFTPPGIPRQVIENIRFYQRTFYVQ